MTSILVAFSAAQSVGCPSVPQYAERPPMVDVVRSLTRGWICAIEPGWMLRVASTEPADDSKMHVGPSGA
jgi:hypothetical protein